MKDLRLLEVRKPGKPNWIFCTLD